MKPFRFFIQAFPYEKNRTLAQQMTMVFAQHDELMAMFDQRVAWAKARSQSESWWDLDLRSCSEHYALIDGFDRTAYALREATASELYAALWACMRRQGWATVKSHAARASDGVNKINQMFRPTRHS
tara:strand:- start:127 stop:507 length:381 start_codon:yes stop_codon:yes gene_type:complete